MVDNPITLNDIASMATIIDVCTQRGAFKATELETVGKLFNKLKAFVDEQTKNSEEAKPTAAEEENPSLDDIITKT